MSEQRAILLTGASGLIGRTVRARLTALGCRVYALSRSDPEAEFYYDERAGTVRLSSTVHIDAVINLGGVNISSGRWSPQRKQAISASRIRLTRVLCQALSALDHPPSVLLSASAVGFYGDTGAKTCDEDSPQGEGFLADVASAWEAETVPAREAGIRTVLLRFGVVLSSQGGMLKELLLPFKLGMGGKLGDGQQWFTWVSLHDVVEAIMFCLQHESVSGPVNVVSGQPVRNIDFTRSLAGALHRPTLNPFLRSSLIQLLFGEMGKTLLLGQSSVLPKVLPAAGFRFQHTDLDEALQYCLNTESAASP